MKHYIYTLLLFSLSIAAYAQPKATFSTDSVNLGTIIWQNPRTIDIRLKNTGDQPLHIKAIESGCGCVNVRWPKENIIPGQEIRISATYDAKQLGSFTRHLDIYTNASPTPFLFSLSGRVIMESRGRATDFLYRLGDICVSNDNIEFDDVRRGDHPIRHIEIYNDSKKTITPDLLHLPSFLTATISPKRLHPQRKGEITIQLNSDKIESMGLTQRSIYFSTFKGQRIDPKNEMVVSVTLLPDVHPDAQNSIISNAPEAVLDATEIDLSRYAGKKRTHTSLYLHNNGTAPLEIKLLQVYNPGISVNISKRIIAPGKKTKIKITLNNESTFFKGRRRILLITNDPNKPKSIIDLTIKK